MLLMMMMIQGNLFLQTPRFPLLDRCRVVLQCRACHRFCVVQQVLKKKFIQIEYIYGD